MKKEEIEPKLHGVMDAVPVCEGLIAANTKGEVIIGQTLTAEMNHTAIAKAMVDMLKVKVDVLSKGTITDITVGLDKGYAVVVTGKDGMVIGLLGQDGKTSVGLLARQIKNIMGQK